MTSKNLFYFTYRLFSPSAAADLTLASTRKP